MTTNGTEPKELAVTMEDFQALIEQNPQLRMPLINIVQARLLVERDAEIAELKSETQPAINA
jgi:hypothetical protein